MDFYGIGLQEIFIVLLIALIVVGPQRLPQMALKLGQIMRRLRMVTSEMARDITEEVNRETTDLKSDIAFDAKEIVKEIENIEKKEEGDQK
ncbi:MAG: twin-arginine translocase TatA/TatE family subunit [Chloroflexi bacterium]|nr:twin-arginine translocase TatA/TatE family subunit [Chloroflexota bacterium]